MRKIFTFLLLVSTVLQAYTIVSFNPSVVYSGSSSQQLASLDSQVGITGYAIESFDQEVGSPLMAGLTLEYEGLGPTSTLPAPTFTINPFTSNCVWDGTKAFKTDIGDRQISGHTGLYRETIFRYSPGTRSFGIGISDIESTIGIIVNDTVNLGTVNSMPNFYYVDGYRNLYIRIDAALNDAPITKVKFYQVDSLSDGIFFDRLAVIIPEPLNIFLLCLGLGIGYWKGCKKN